MKRIVESFEQFISKKNTPTVLVQLESGETRPPKPESGLYEVGLELADGEHIEKIVFTTTEDYNNIARYYPIGIFKKGETLGFYVDLDITKKYEDEFGGNIKPTKYKKSKLHLEITTLREGSNFTFSVSLYDITNGGRFAICNNVLIKGNREYIDAVGGSLRYGNDKSLKDVLLQVFMYSKKITSCLYKYFSNWGFDGSVGSWNTKVDGGLYIENLLQGLRFSVDEKTQMIFSKSKDVVLYVDKYSTWDNPDYEGEYEDEYE
jgi:hypothetical protein